MDTSADPNCPDTSADDNCPEKCPPADQRKHADSDAWTLADAPACTECGWPLDSAGHETNCGGLDA